jgi:transposase
MEVIYPRCGALDVHKKSVTAGVRISEGSKVTKDVRPFDTTTKGLLALSDWLSSYGVTHVVMEATGVYWRPVWNVLSASEELTLTLANAAHVKNVPGRKTDVSDTDWMLDLHAHGLIRPSFVPDRATQELREIMRSRKQMVREQTRNVQRIQKTLEVANIKLDSVLSDILGKSGRAMLDAMAAGESDPVKLAALAHKGVQASQEQLRQALNGRMNDHHRFLLRVHLKLIDFLDMTIAKMDEQVEANLQPFRDAVELVCTAPGFRQLGAQSVVAEIGIDMSRFPSAAHLVSWTGICTRQDVSAGKRRSRHLRRGNPWLKTALIQAAHAARKKKGTYLQALYLRLKTRRGPQKAVCAVAASLVTSIYHMLKNGVPYEDLGPDHFHNRSHTSHARRLVRQLERLGYNVDLNPQKAELATA